jgi:hypothetical protein
VEVKMAHAWICMSILFNISTEDGWRGVTLGKGASETGEIVMELKFMGTGAGIGTGTGSDWAFGIKERIHDTIRCDAVVTSNKEFIHILNRSGPLPRVIQWL